MTRELGREDVFISVCFADFPADNGYLSELAKLSRRLTAQYRYYEILIVVVADAPLDYQSLINQTNNVRLLTTRSGTPLYRRRLAAASEAIGDIVVLASIDEQPALDLIEMIELTSQKNSIVIGRRSKSSVMNPALRALGRAAGFRVDMCYMLTASYPRALLSKLLVHPDRQVALRFPPADRGIPVVWLSDRESRSRTRSVREFGRRLSVVQKLLVSSAPRVLTLVSLLSLAVTCASVAFAIYAVIVWSTLVSIQPGWFTTTLAISLTTAFLGKAIFGLTVGLQKIIEALSNDVVDDIIEERSTINMFDQAMKDLNVEITAVNATVANQR
ncbi:hypothetical protein [Bradyrhizobium archetypum]|uniref:Uncharacterized protein n=1 Tax=Bradyrhizobium archetypum TaxID=2721160 RepID=A0A7Y4HB29_9BRAD|nr:hypothetical protein [Bradyrhizobium archetypum]NOJ50949.1 hypothetical protein [Bradyrhizobium archetypum]